MNGSVDLPAADAANVIQLTGLNRATLTDLTVTDANQNGILLTNANGDFSVQDSRFVNSGSRAIFLQDVEGTVNLSDNNVEGALNEGIYLRDVTGTVIIDQNTVQDIRYKPTLAGGSGIEGGIVHTNTRGTVNTRLTNNLVDIDPNGTTLALTGEALLDIDGMEVNMFDTAVGKALVEGNTLRNTDDDGIDSDTNGTAQLDIIIRGNTLSEIQDRSISFVSAGNGTVRGLIEGNTITGPTTLNPSPDVDADGIGIRPRQDSTMNITVRNNTVTNPGRKGIDINMNRGDGSSGPVNNATAFFRFEGNTVSNAGQRALDIQLEDTSRATGVMVNNTVNGANGDGIRVRSGAGAGAETNQLFVGLFDNSVTGATTAADAGIFVRAQNDSRLCARIVENSSDNSGGVGLDYFLRSQQNAVLELFGITTPIPAANPSPALTAALAAQGNTGRNANFPSRVQNNSVQVPSTNCTFPNNTFAPTLPQ
ncbi:MAG: right-handed parallel beta-helix repeat-containing protein [Thermostichus sp. HHBFW_bins_43]